MADVANIHRHILVFVLLCVVVVFGVRALRGHETTRWEARAERLVGHELRQDVTCRDTHVTNLDVLPDHPGYFSCRTESGAKYHAIIRADGSFLSLRREAP